MPGIRYVVDPGTARISRYSQRAKVQRLPIEPVSPGVGAASAPGRCGRVADGICIRLYTEDDFDARPEFTDPEILRTNLASVILQMAALGPRRRRGLPVRRPARPPRRRATAWRCCDELRRAGADERAASAPPHRRSGAGSRGCRSTRGSARMVLEADRARLPARGAGRSPPALSIQDPRERPAEQRQARRRSAHAPASTDDGRPTSSPASTCGATCASSSEALSGNQFRRTCKRGVPALPAHPRVAGPARPAAPGRPRGRLGIDASASRPPSRDDGASTARCWPACSRTSGCRPSCARQRDGGRGAGREYLGARGARFVLSPGSPLAQEAAALGDGRRAGRDHPAVGPHGRADRAGVGRAARAEHLVKRHVLRAALGSRKRRRGRRHRAGHAVRPADRRRPRAVQLRRDRPGRRPRAVHPARPGGGRVGRPATAFFADNRALLDEVEELEDRARRRDIAGRRARRCSSSTTRACRPRSSPARHFDRWWKQARRQRPRPARPSPRELLRAAAAGRSTRRPTRTRCDGSAG